MKPLLEITVPAHEGRLTIRHCLKLQGVSQALRRRLKEQGSIQINGKTVTWDYLLNAGEHMVVYLPPEQDFAPYALDLDILYEDAYLLAINKPAGLLMHPTASERKHTLANALQYHYQKTGQTLDFHPIHRLDKDTSGIVLIAKNPMVQHAFTKQQTPMTKTYAALVEGHFAVPHCTVRFPIARKPGSIIERMCAPHGESAHSDLTCVVAGEHASLLYVTIYTGRTHQIRVHCATLGYPLVGDDLYGGGTEILQRQGLHAQIISFTHPMTQERITLRSPLPKDIKQALWQYDLLTIG